MIIKKFNPESDLVFDLKVVEACKSCKRYGLTGCCPPNIGEIEYYKKLLRHYKYGEFYIERFEVEDADKWVELGKSSSLVIHDALIEAKNKLLNEGHYFNIILGSGSCKKCTKCVIPCVTPQYRAIPIEATGVDVVSTLDKLGLFIKFPVRSHFYRIGAILWD
jgi:predicted metal-binding protein